MKLKKHNTQPQVVSAATNNPAMATDEVRTDCAKLGQAGHKLQLIVAEINQFRNETNDTAIRLRMTNILRAAGVMIDAN